MWDSTTSRDDAHRPKWWDAPMVAKREYPTSFGLAYVLLILPIVAVIGVLLWLFIY